MNAYICQNFEYVHVHYASINLFFFFFKKSHWSREGAAEVEDKHLSRKKIAYKDEAFYLIST